MRALLSANCLCARAFGKQLRCIVFVLLSNCGLLIGQTLDHFSWSAVPSSIQAGQFFQAGLEARDAGNNLVTNFNEIVFLSELTPTVGATILITEVETVAAERVELSNVSPNPVDISGWRVV